MMIKQYPYFLEKITSSSGYQDGDYIVGEDVIEPVGICRDSPNASGSLVNSADGQSIDYKSTVFLPRAEYNLKAGDRVRVIEKDGEVRAQGSIIRYVKEQLHCRLWI